MDKRNPIVALLVSKNFKPKDFSPIYGCSLNSLRMVTSGQIDNIPKGVLEALRRAGFDITDIDQKYKEWQLMTAKERLANNVN